MVYLQKEYFNDDRTLEWGQNIPPEKLEGLRKGEILTLLDENGDPLKKIFMDSYDTIRQQKLEDNRVPGINPELN